MAQITLNSTGVASDGALVLQSNGTTAALTIDTSQRAAFVAGTAALPAITTTGDTNTGIFFPAADTIAFAEGGVEAMRITSAGNVNIGTGTAQGKLEIQQSTATAALWVQTGGTTAADVVADFRTGSNAPALQILGNATSSFWSTVGVGNATPSTSGAGITFPATQSASTNANTLDDYEEGSYSPTLTQTDNTAPSVTYSVQVGRYTKVGTIVHVQGYINLSSTGTASGNVRFSNLPFANTGTSNALAAPTISIFGNTTSLTTAYILSGDMGPSQTFMTLGYSSGAGGGSTLTWANLQNTFFIEFSFTYQALA